MSIHLRIEEAGSKQGHIQRGQRFRRRNHHHSRLSSRISQPSSPSSSIAQPTDVSIAQPRFRRRNHHHLRLSSRIAQPSSRISTTRLSYAIFYY
jgi:hypothetical protein